jgi:hypothetical protein
MLKRSVLCTPPAILLRAFRSATTFVVLRRVLPLCVFLLCSVTLLSPGRSASGVGTGLSASGARVPSAQATLPLIDDFTVGSYRSQLDGANQNNSTDPGRVQRDPSGAHILGGKRYTGFATGGQPYGQSAVLQILPGGNPVLVQSAGVRVSAGLQMFYGLDVNLLNQNVVTPLHANLTPYDRFRVSFDIADGSLNFNMQIRGSNGGLSGWGINTPGAVSTASPTGHPFCVEFPFENFSGFPPAPNLDDVSYINLLINATSGGMYGTDYAITRVEAANGPQRQPACLIAKKN